MEQRFWVEQRFSAAFRNTFPEAASAAETATCVGSSRKVYRRFPIAGVMANNRFNAHPTSLHSLT